MELTVFNRLCGIERPITS